MSSYNYPSITKSERKDALVPDHKNTNCPNPTGQRLHHCHSQRRKDLSCLIG